MRRLHMPDDLAGIADEALARVIRQRFTELAAYDDYPFDELAEFWLVEPGDTVQRGQVLAQLELWNTRKDRSVGVEVLPKVLDEEVARLHLAKIGCKLTVLRPEQADYIGVPVEGPYKPDFYRY